METGVSTPIKVEKEEVTPANTNHVKAEDTTAKKASSEVPVKTERVESTADAKTEAEKKEDELSLIVHVDDDAPNDLDADIEKSQEEPGKEDKTPGVEASADGESAKDGEESASSANKESEEEKSKATATTDKKSEDAPATDKKTADKKDDAKKDVTKSKRLVCISGLSEPTLGFYAKCLIIPSGPQQLSLSILLVFTALF